GIPSIAISQAYGPQGRDRIEWDCARHHAPGIIRRLLEEGIPKEILFNINFPNVPASEVAGVAVTAQGRRDQELMRLEPRQDGRGNPYFWIAFQRSKSEPANGTDLRALAEKKISVTPIELDLTHEPTLTRFAQVFV
ncbi:MAG: 5'/3'-nucleotidase SurE, partial [Bosea sp. (in: a-proteobacteria)]